jgi:predicted nucleic acid-binding protein
MSSSVLDASAAVELLMRTVRAGAVEQAIRGTEVAVPGHFDAEVLSALGRLARAGEIRVETIEPALNELARAPFRRFALPPLLTPAWRLRDRHALRDALYVTLAERLGAVLVTADGRLARALAPSVRTILIPSP